MKMISGQQLLQLKLESLAGFKLERSNVGVKVTKKIECMNFLTD